MVDINNDAKLALLLNSDIQDRGGKNYSDKIRRMDGIFVKIKRKESH